MLPAALVLLAAESPAELGFLDNLYPLVDLGLSGLLVGVLIWFVRRRETLVSSGEWVSRRELDYFRENYEARLADKDRQNDRERQVSAEYRAALETSEHARELLAQQVRDAVEAVRTSNRFLEAFRAHVIEARPAGAGSDAGDVDGSGR